MQPELFIYYYFCIISFKMTLNIALSFWNKGMPEKEAEGVKGLTEGLRVGGKEEMGGQLTLSGSDRGERAGGFVFPADPNTESFLTRPTRHGVTE